MRRFLFTWTVLLCLSAGVVAQTNDSAQLRRWNQELGVWAAYSPDSNVGIGQSQHRKFFELNGQYALTFWAPRSLAVKWVSEVVPVALLNEPTEYYFNTKHVQTGKRAGATTYAGGVTPLGMQINFLNGHRVQPFVDAHGGMLYFTRQEPVPNSSQFNFTFNFGAGVQLFTTRRSSMLLGYKYHHISNNETAPQNPGVDSSEAYAGYVWRFR
jgi:opacity protein-like surface antigen